MAKERTGYVFKSNGKFYARFDYTDSNGKRRQVKRIAKTKSEAERILKTLLREFEDQGETAIEAVGMTFNELADYYEENYAKPAKFVNNRKIEGLRDLKHVQLFLRVFREYFGKKKLRSITYGDLMKFRSHRLETPTRRNTPRMLTTANRELSCLRRIFNIALRQGWIIKNPFNCGDTLIESSAERKRERILTLDEERRLLAACDHPQRKHLKPLLIALLDTGARKGETLKLIWRDIDFERRLITFQAENTKTLKTRQVAMTSRLYKELEKLWYESNKNLNGFVFGIKDNVKRSFSSACREAGIKEGGINGLTLHCLRHSAATRLVKGQMPIQMVGRILGHTQPQTTYRYLTANDETLHQAASILEKLQELPVSSEFIN